MKVLRTERRKENTARVEANAHVVDDFSGSMTGFLRIVESKLHRVAVGELEENFSTDMVEEGLLTKMKRASCEVNTSNGYTHCPLFEMKPVVVM